MNKGPISTLSVLEETRFYDRRFFELFEEILMKDVPAVVSLKNNKLICLCKDVGFNIQSVLMDLTRINSAVHNYNLSYDLGFEWYRFSGSVKTNTRELCLHLNKRKYIHVSEFESIIRGQLDDINFEMENGVVKGMYETTSKDNYLLFCNGHGCGHGLFGVSDLLVPTEIKAKY